MTAEEYFNEHYKPRLVIRPAKWMFDFAEDYAEAKIKAPSEKVFKPSIHGIKIAALIERKFGIQLEPLIHRRYKDAEDVKFEMRDLGGILFQFEGLVLEFIAPGQRIELVDENRFCLIRSNYRIQ